MNLKEIMAADLDVFLNTDEFADEHTLGGKKIRLIIDSDTLNGTPLPHAEGVSLWRKVIYVSCSDLGYRPNEGGLLELDNQTYEVVNVDEQDGLFVITLEANAM
ncbi:hypothetical protein J31TS6_40340 [Brevibacillus reuszeri]|uniref:hypothetical protein n=1 Tax=Brevibacillus reuszeri TaxID=54915 RepID=UPI001B0C676E|nr:hypothetical protein [Brevibacillus reuszeri]GIO08006.1 hypothetical protein J31TS6_40340 [Brevibacillus reuszeri]